MRPREAIILAAGSGRRLSEATGGRPKCLVEVRGRTILERQMTAFRDAGVERFVVVTGYEAREVERAAKEATPRATVEAVYNPRYAQTNVLTSWLLGSEKLRGDHYYAHADTVFAPELLEKLRDDARTAINLTFDGHECAEEEMKVRLQDDRLVEISKTMPSAHAHGEFTGIMSMSAEALVQLRRVASELLARDGADKLFVEAALQVLLERGMSSEFTLVDISGVPWREIDFPEDLAAAEALFRQAG